MTSMMMGQLSGASTGLGLPFAILCCPPHRPPQRGIVVSHTFSTLPHPRVTSLVSWEKDNSVFIAQGRKLAARNGRN